VEPLVVPALELLARLELAPALLVRLVPEPVLPLDQQLVLVVVLVFDFDRPFKNITSSTYKLILIYHN